LYRNDKKYTDPNYKLHSFLQNLNPLHWIGFIFQGPKAQTPEEKTANQE